MHPQSTIAPATQVHIYALVDPRDRQVRYIGQTAASLERRLSRHVSEALTVSDNTLRSTWVRELYEAKLLPTIQLLETVDAQDADRAERAQIVAYQREGTPLTNSIHNYHYEARRKRTERKEHRPLPEGLLTVTQAAELAGVSDRTIRTWRREKKIGTVEWLDGYGHTINAVSKFELLTFLGRTAEAAELDAERLAAEGGAATPTEGGSGEWQQGTEGSGRMELMGVPDRIRLADVVQQLDALSQALHVLPAVATAVEALTQRVDALVIAQEAGQGSEPVGQPELRAAVDALTTQVQALNDAQAAAVRAQAIPADAIPDQRTGLLRRLLGLRTKDVGDHAEGRTLG